MTDELNAHDEHDKDMELVSEWKQDGETIPPEDQETAAQRLADLRQQFTQETTQPPEPQSNQGEQ